MRILSNIILALILFTTMGFDFSRHSIPLEEVLPGGPPKDGIPAITKPKFVEAEKGDLLKAEDRILGVFYNGEAKA